MMLTSTLLCGALLLAQDPQQQAREKPEDYPARVALPNGWTLAVDYLARSLPAEGGVLFTPDHIVIEIKIFGPTGKTIQLAPREFQLTVNKKTPSLTTDSSNLVIASMQNSVMNSTKPTLTGQGQINDGPGVIFGRRRSGIPDIDGRSQGPSAPRTPDGTIPGSQREPVDIRAEVEKVTLADRERRLPAGGLIYFPYRGKLKSIKTMVLHYMPEEGKTFDVPLVP